MSSKVYYGWYVAALAGLGIASSVAVFIPATIGLLAEPVTREFGWSAQQIFFGPTFATASTILVAPFIGRAVDHFGARPVLLVSFLVEALLIASFRFLDDSLPLFYARYAAFALLGTGTTAVAFATLVSRWFDRRRGLALGIALAGTGLGGVLWSIGTQALFDRVGWRDAFLYLGAIVAFVILPLLLLVIRESPQAMGLEVDGEASAAGTRPDPLAQRDAVTSLSLRQAVATGQYWLMAVTFFLCGLGIQGVQLHVVPMLKAQGESAAIAAAVQASLWAALVIGRLASGWLMDRYFAPRVAMAFLMAPVAGVAMLAAGASGGAAFLGAMLVGLCAGAEVDVIAYTTGRYFGLRNYAQIYATFFSTYALGTAVGPPLTAWATGVFGGYGQVIGWYALVYIAAAVLFLRFQPFNSLRHPGAAVAAPTSP